MAVYKFIRSLLPGGPVYVRIRSDRLHLRDVTTGREWKEVPEAAVRSGSKPTVVAVGSMASQAALREPGNVKLMNGYAHPRTMIADFTIAEKVLQHAVNLIFEGRLLRPAPILVMHPLERLEGGLTGVEERALLELAAGAGAREAHIWVGRELTDSEIKDGKMFESPG